MQLRSVRPPDLEMRVRTVREAHRTRLAYTFHSPTGVVAFSHRELPGPWLQTSPELYQASLAKRIEQLGQLRDIDDSPLLPGEVDRKLASLGRELWRELFPLEVRLAYREIRRSVESWMIISDEPWIPWELARPFDDSDPDDVLDDDFLVYRFELTRWLSGDKNPALEIHLDVVAVLQTDSELPQAAHELTFLRSLVAAHEGIDGTFSKPSSTSELLRHLETHESRLIHLIGHGESSLENPDDSGIPLPDGSYFRPSDLDGAILTRIRRNRPLVFLNACWSGNQGWSLTSLGGWAPRWVGLCGCGAFVAPMWPVRDRAALAFAEVFYRSLEEGKTLGRAALEARRHLQESRPGDASALAYTVYGSPGALLQFAPRPTASPAESRPEVAERRTVAVPIDAGLAQRANSRTLRWRRSLPFAVLLGFAVVLIFARPEPQVLEPTAQAPAATPQEAAKEPTITEESPPKPAPLPAKPPAAAVSDGLRLDLGGGDRGLRDAFRKELQRRAGAKNHAPWVVRVTLDPAACNALELDQFKQVTCRLSAVFEGTVGGRPVSADSVSVSSAQFTEEIARRAAAEALAAAVAARFSEVE